MPPPGADDPRARLLDLHEQISISIDALEAPEKLFTRACELLCAATDRQLGQVWQVSGDGAQMRCAGGWHAADGQLASFHAAALTEGIGRGQRLAGRVWETGRPIWTSDLSREPNLAGSGRAGMAGLKSAVAVPMTLAGQFEGVLEMYGSVSTLPGRELMATMRSLAAQLAAYCDHWRARERLGSREENSKELSALEEGFASLPDGVIVQDSHGGVAACNPKIARIVPGLSAEQLTGQYPIPAEFEPAFEDGSHWSADTAPPMRTLRSGEAVHEAIVSFRRPDGATAWVAINCQPLQRGAEERPYGVVSSFTDITERRENEKRIVHLAYHDKLTDLPNRALMNNHLDLALARARRSDLSVALLYLDLDDFKLVNDSLGHEVGDQLLRQTAARLDEITRATDLLARQAGDEFMLVLTDLPSDDAVEAAGNVAQQVRRKLEAAVTVADAEFQLGVSIGISVYPRDASDSAELLEHGETAMYQAKNAGRGGHAFFTHGEVDPLERLSMTSQLRTALEREEFELYYQPLFDLSDGCLYGAEALIRWKSPSRGLVAPLEFIPLAEDTGLIEPIGDWVIQEVCRQAAEWREADLEPHLSFNVSPRQLRKEDLARAICDRIGAQRLNPSQFTVEITETAAMQESGGVSPILGELAQAGLRVAIDDFGAGYSSLGRLRELPVQTLKIDRAFLYQVPERSEATSIVQAIIRLAAGLGMRTIAEGIETQEQLDFLKAEGCSHGQGFHLGRPLPAREMTALLHAQRSLWESRPEAGPPPAPPAPPVGPPPWYEPADAE
ncbi:MAG: EAL domain-containing protein [Thermoleophilaceae bacterium]|nr:EAL domain-containing protein [Thermoleophilaceae bacterium]